MMAELLAQASRDPTALPHTCRRVKLMILLIVFEFDRKLISCVCFCLGVHEKGPTREDACPMKAGTCSEWPPGHESHLFDAICS